MQVIMHWLARSPFGGWFKAFLSAALAAFLVSGGDIFDLSSVAALKGLAAAGVAGTVPVVINWLNRSDPRYGGGAKTTTPLLATEPAAAPGR